MFQPTFRLSIQRAGGAAALLSAALAAAALGVAVIGIGPAALADEARLAQLAVSNPAPLILQDALKFAQAAAAAIVIAALQHRLSDRFPRTVTLATLCGALSVGCLVLNAAVSLLAVTQAAGLAAAHSDLGVQLSRLAGLLALGVLGLNGLWYGLVSWTALKSQRLPRPLGRLGMLLGGLSLVPPLAVLVLLLGAVWSVWLGVVLITDHLAAPAAAGRAAGHPGPATLGRVLRWVPAAVVAAVAAGLVGLLLFSGGMLKVRAWYLLQSLLPALGLITLVLSGLAALVRRHASPALLLTGVLSGLALVPAVQILAPIMAYPASITAMTPSATVRLPADAPLTVLWGGDTLAVNRHVVVPDQRWAYDLVVAPYLTGSARLTDYGCYGLPVLAPAAGVVVVAHDGEPDRVPGAGSQNFEAPEGNFVALRLETGTYLILAHLKPGSLAVQVGERVAEGQPLGQCGNSGNTSEPHIHIHHQRQDPASYPLNFAEGLPLFFRGHDGPPMPEGGVQLLNGQLIASGQTVRDLGQGGQVRRQP